MEKKPRRPAQKVSSSDEFSSPTIHALASVLEAVSLATDALKSGQPVEDALPCALEQLGKKLRLSRVDVFRHEAAAARHLLVSEWLATGVHSLLPEGETALADADFPDIVRTIFKGETYGSFLTEKAGRDYEVNAQAGTMSDLVVPIRRGGAHWGALSIDDTRHYRVWTWQEVLLFQRFANAIGDAIA